MTESTGHKIFIILLKTMEVRCGDGLFPLFRLLYMMLVPGDWRTTILTLGPPSHLHHPSQDPWPWCFIKYSEMRIPEALRF